MLFIWKFFSLLGFCVNLKNLFCSLCVSTGNSQLHTTQGIRVKPIDSNGILIIEKTLDSGNFQSRLSEASRG